MRWVLLVLLPPALAVAGGEGNEAEKLFRDLEERVGKAKVVRIAFASKIMKDGKESGHFKGSVILEEGAKARIEVQGSVDGKDVSLRMVSDGKKMKVFASPVGKEVEEPLPKHFGTMARNAMSRVGPTAALLLVHPRVQGKDEPDLAKLLGVSDFKLGERTKVEGRDVRVVEYRVNLMDEKVFVKLWLDAKTHLPLKRREGSDKKGEGVQIFETYSEFKLGSKGKGQAPAPPK
jgi:outer membrane lipoprotein-sorting protein